MKYKRGLLILLAAIMTVTAAIAMPACSCGGEPEPQDEFALSALGSKVRKRTVADPSEHVTLRLVRGKKVLAEGEDALSYNGKLAAGDIVEADADYRYFNVDMFGLGETLIYSPSGRFTFQVPPAAAQSAYAPDAFGSASPLLKASVATDAQVREERDLALNPYDYMFVDEKNDPAALAAPLASAAIDGDEVTAFPHAYANRVTRNEADFYARNAIDGQTEAGGHGNYPYQSWGYDRKEDAALTVYFGRSVTLSELAFVVRADYAGAKEHDTWLDSAEAVFSDGSSQTFAFAKTGERQRFALDAPVTTEYVRIRNMREHENANSEMYVAITEFEAYGSAAAGNAAAEKTYVTPGFGGKDARKFTTDVYRAAEIAAQAERVNKWFVDITDRGELKIPMYDISRTEVVRINENEWKDSVYYSGLTDALLTTGNMDHYYYLRGVGGQFGYKVNNGYFTPHGDWYQIGETYLQLNDLRGAAYKTAHVTANADHNLTRKAGDRTPNDRADDRSRDWSHMGFWWCDSLYMAMNTYTMLSAMTGNDAYVRAAYDGYKYWKGKLYNETYHLWHRDTTQLGLTTDETDPATGKKYPVFWSRGGAWVFAALAKQLLYLDAERFPEIYAAYSRDFAELAAAIARYQRADGLWNSSVIGGTIGGKSYDGKETTGTSGFLYGFAVGVGLGVLDGGEYFPVISAAYDGMLDGCMIGDTDQLGYMQTVGYQPQNYVSESFTREISNEFGMGLFLMASSALMRLCDDYVPPLICAPADPQAALL